MAFSHFDFTGRGFERAADELADMARLPKLREVSSEPESDLAEVELDDDERRDAIARERLRRGRTRS